MSKKPLIIMLVIVASIGAGGAYLLLGDEGKQAKDQMVENPGPSAPPASEPSQESTAGAYIDYQDGVIASTKDTKLLFFYAPWCPQCRALEADIKAKGMPAGITIIKVDYDTNQALRQKYGVTIQTTVVRVDDSGELVKKFVAYDEPSVQAVRDNLL